VRNFKKLPDQGAGLEPITGLGEDEPLSRLQGSPAGVSLSSVVWLDRGGVPVAAQPATAPQKLHRAGRT